MTTQNIMNTVNTVTIPNNFALIDLDDVQSLALEELTQDYQGEDIYRCVDAKDIYLIPSLKIIAVACEVEERWEYINDVYEKLSPIGDQDPTTLDELINFWSIN